MALRYLFISELYNEGWFDLEYCPTDQQLADIMTKPLLSEKFVKLRDKFMSAKEDWLKTLIIKPVVFSGSVWYYITTVLFTILFLVPKVTCQMHYPILVSWILCCL